jgi:hypothetical protein
MVAIPKEFNNKSAFLKKEVGICEKEKNNNFDCGEGGWTIWDAATKMFNELKGEGGGNVGGRNKRRLEGGEWMDEQGVLEGMKRRGRRAERWETRLGLDPPLAATTFWLGAKRRLEGEELVNGRLTERKLLRSRIEDDDVKRMGQKLDGEDHKKIFKNGDQKLKRRRGNGWDGMNEWWKIGE